MSRQNTGRPRLSKKAVRERLAHLGEPVEPPVTAGAVAEQHAAAEELDDAWLAGELDPETLGGWSQRF
ncbi:MAG: hypothetical protein R2716_13970 [Microthrixaceae bacterium]